MKENVEKIKADARNRFYKVGEQIQGRNITSVGFAPLEKQLTTIVRYAL
jgi:hypothetical protein